MKTFSIPAIILLLTITLFSACESNSTSKGNKQTDDANLMGITTITSFIKEYYHKEFQQYRKTEKTTFDNIFIGYEGRLAETDSAMYPLINIDIPKLNAEAGIYKGDLNNDKARDLIVVVHTEGGGGGGNIASEDYFTFTSKDGKYLFNSMTNMNELSGCPENYGYFGAEVIRDNILYGTSSCYAESDGRCCPSLKYKTEVVLKGNKLVFQNKTETAVASANQ